MRRGTTATARPTSRCSRTRARRRGRVCSPPRRRSHSLPTSAPRRRELTMATALVCDLCPHGKKSFAVAKVEIDVCKRHHRGFAQAKNLLRPKPKGIHGVGVGDPKLQQALLALLGRNRDKSLARPDFIGKLPSHWSTAQRALLQLCDEKLVTRIGKGKYTRYQLTPKRAGGARQKEARSSRRARGGAEAAPRRRGKRPPSKRAQGSNGAAHEAGLRAPAGSA